MAKDDFTPRKVVRVAPEPPELNPELVPPSDAHRPTVRPEVALDGSLPDAGDSVFAQKAGASPDVRAELPGTSEAVIPQVRPESALSPALPETGDERTGQRYRASVSADAELPDTGDAACGQSGHSSRDLNLSLPDLSDAPNAQRGNVSIPVPIDLPEVGGLSRSAVKSETVLSPEIPPVSDAAVGSRAESSATLSAQCPDVADALNAQRGRQIAPVSPALPEAGDVVCSRTRTPIDFSGKLPELDGSLFTEKSREFSFTGSLRLYDDPLNIGAQNYAELQNFRYRDYGIEGAGGFSYVNTTSLGVPIRNAIQLRTNYAAQRSAILAQTHSGNTRKIVANESVIPDPGNFGSGPFTITGSNNTLYLTVFHPGVGTGSSPVSIPPTTIPYATGADLAAAIQSQLNFNTILRLSGAVSWLCSYSESTHKFTITPTAPATVTYTVSSIGDTIGFTADQGPASSITSDTGVTTDVALYTDTTGTAGLARFAYLPQGNVGMCDGAANRIWAGEEMPVGAFLYGTHGTIPATSTQDNIEFTTGSGTAMIDIPDGTYTGTALATAMQTQLRANATLAVPNAVVEFRLGKFWIDAGAGKTIKCTGGGDFAPLTGFGVDSGAGVRLLWSPGTWSPTGGWGTLSFFNSLQDNTSKVNNSLSDSANTVVIGNSTANKHFLIGATRPIQGLKFTNTNGNFATATLSGTYFDGEKMAVLTSLSVSSDGLVDTVTFDSTASSARPIFVNGYYLYFYDFALSTGSVTVSQVTANAAHQVPVDIWDGVYRTCTWFNFSQYISSKNTDVDYTLEVAEKDLRDYSADKTNPSLAGQCPIGTLSTSPTGEYIEVWFSEPICGFKWDFSAVEKTANCHAISVAFWDGTQYVGARTAYDTLKDAGDNFYFGVNSGVNFFELPMYNNDGTAYTGSECISEKNGRRGYRYKIQYTFIGASSFTELVLDQFKGIPRYRKMEKNYAFPFQYRNRAFWCGCLSDGEVHRADYSGTNAPDVYNGDDSSKFDNSQSLYFGGKDALTGAAELFNQYGLNLASGALFFKNTETYLLTGSAPSGDDPFKIHKISGQVGCPAPLTITPAEVSYTTGDAPPANIVLWLSSTGPMMYFNASIYCIPGIEPYFRQDDARCVNPDALPSAGAWYDAQFQEWNIVIPSGSSATTNNVWLVYDLVRRKWWQRVSANTADFPQGGFAVQDQYGNKYAYAFTASGRLLRLENTLYDGTAAYGLVNLVKTADILPADTLWLKTTARRIKVLSKSNADGTLAITHYGDGETTGTTVETAAVMNPTANRYANRISQLYGTSGAQHYALTALTHAFQFSVSGAVKAKPYLMGWGMQWLVDHTNEAME
jgi:hypothetical protein